MEIEVNDYVRTKNGRIFRWSSLCTTDIEDYMEHTRKILFIEDEIKSSPNIIDLIEVGDYVNGHYVEGVEKVPNEEVYKVIITSTCDGMDGETLNIYKEEIESIVTKEQFSSMEYKIGE